MKIRPKRYLIVDYDSLLEDVPEDFQEYKHVLATSLVAKALKVFKASRGIVYTQSDPPPLCDFINFAYSNQVPKLDKEWPYATLSGSRGSPWLDYQSEDIKIFFRPDETYTGVKVVDHDHISKTWAGDTSLIPDILGLAEQKGSISAGILLMKRIVDGRPIKVKKEIEMISNSKPHTSEIVPVQTDDLVFDVDKARETGFGFVLPYFNSLTEYLDKQDKLDFLAFYPRETALKEYLASLGDTVAVDCVVPGTRILMGDLSWRNVEDISDGDIIVGFDENKPDYRGTRRYHLAEATNLGIVEDEIYEIGFEDGSLVRCNGKHKWLARGGGDKTNSLQWVPTSIMYEKKNGNRRVKYLVPKPLDVWDTNTSYGAGFLAGSFDADGCMTGSSSRGHRSTVSFSQVDNALMERVKIYLSKLGFDFGETIEKSIHKLGTQKCNKLYIRGGYREHLRFLGEIRPPRLLERWILDNRIDDSMMQTRRKLEITYVKYLGKSEIVRMGSSTKTYIAEGFLAHNTETTGLDVLSFGVDTCIGVSISGDPKVGAYIPISGQGETIEKILADPSKTKIMHNSKFDMAVIKKLPNYEDLNGPVYDTMIAAYLLGYGVEDDGGYAALAKKPLSLKTLTRTLLDYEMTLIDDLKTKEGKLDLSTQSLGQLAPYAASDALFTFNLWQKFKPELEQQGMWELFELENRCSRHLLDMEDIGVYIDLHGIKQAQEETINDLEVKKQEVYDAIGHPNARDYDIDSPKQLSVILFDLLKLSPIKSKSTGFSVDKETLGKLEDAHPCIRILQEYKTLRTLLDTYLVQLPKNIGADGRFHTTYKQTKVVTGRLASRPNLLAIPARGPGKIIRSLFKPQRKGWVYVGADFSQLEIRVMAHFSQDPTLMNLYLTEEEEIKKGRKPDVYKTVASQVLGIPEDEVDSDQRSKAKILTLGTNYAMTEHGFARQSGLSKEEAKEFQRKYFEAFAALPAWMDGAKETARRELCARSIMGRRRLLPDIISDVWGVKSDAERAAINYPIQATAADIAKTALDTIMAGFSVLDIKDKAHLILHVHDEYIIECKEEVAEDVKWLVREAMVGAGLSLGLRVPLRTDVTIGDSWAAVK